MKIKLLFFAAFLGVIIVANAQTLYVPNGTGGIANNSINGNVLIGYFNNTNNLKLSIPGVYNFEQVNLGQFGNGACGLEFINHTSVNPSYGVRLFANVDQTPGLQIQTANSVNSYNDLAYNTRMFISLDGNIGIGTRSPTGVLDVRGTNQRISIGDGTNQLTFGQWDAVNNRIESANRSLLITTYTGNINIGPSGSSLLCISANNNVGIGTTNPLHKLEVFNGGIVSSQPSDQPWGFGIKTSASWGGWGRQYAFFSSDGTQLAALGAIGIAGNQISSVYIGQGFSSNGTEGPRWLSILTSNGNVGIGTTNPQNKLDVNGTIRAKEVKVETGWADFVFAPTYKLRPLTEVEQFIKINGHLPEIPKAEDVQQNGVNLGEMQTKLLQKVEELTLYVIEQEKTNAALQQQLIIQAQENQELKEEMKEMKKLLMKKLK